jgi:type IV pilus assembly protein PilA
MTRFTTRVTRGEAESGFTLMELLVVLVILGVLLSIAVPAYLTMTSKAEHATAEANVRAAVPAVEAFYADNSTYVGMDNPANGTPPGISQYDPGSAGKIHVSTNPAPSQTSYCIYSTQGGSTYFKHGPAGDITLDPGPVLDDCNAST